MFKIIFRESHFNWAFPSMSSFQISFSFLFLDKSFIFGGNMSFNLDGGLKNKEVSVLHTAFIAN